MLVLDIVQESAVVFHACIARDAVNVYWVVRSAHGADDGYSLQKFHVHMRNVQQD